MCVEEKLKKFPFSKETTNTVENVLDRVHSDIVGPITPPSRGGYKYAITYVDEWTNYVQVYLLKGRRDALNSFKQYLQMTKTQTRKQ